mmetsp:Transcript_50484/g.124091  ORF Transcript_50484/g.124091 Transcript_50484/m.124091 type:complete len:303 (-) Transcript_50484:676-1584(-)
MVMKVLIAGATGLIGKELVRQCQEEGIHVHYLTTRKEQLGSLPFGKGFLWNPHSGEIDVAAFNGVTAIVNLAGASVSKRWTRRHKKRILASRLMTARLIYETLSSLNHQVSQYLSASGISIYPSSFEKMYLEDETTLSQSFLGNVVMNWEKEADAFQELGMAVTKVRTGIVLAKGEGALPKLVKPIQMGFGAVLGNGRQWQSWIHVKDMAAMYVFLLKNRLPGVFNGISPSPCTHQKMAQSIASQLKKSLWLPKVPSLFLKLLLGEMSDLVLESQLVGSKKIEEAGFQFQYVNLENALADLL